MQMQARLADYALIGRSALRRSRRVPPPQNRTSGPLRRLPGPTSCIAIVADAVLSSSSSRARSASAILPRPAHVLRAILARSLAQHDAAADAVARMHRRSGAGTDPSRRAALADCVQLMDLARNRLAGALAPTGDARTWLSAALTYYATCADGVGGGSLVRDDAVAARLVEPLKSLASASLAVLNAVDGGSGSRDAEAVDTFPTWVPARDRALLEAGAGAIKADVVVAQDGSGKYRTVKEAVDAAPDGGNSRYVIYVKKGVYRENVEVGKKKRELMIVGDGMDATDLRTQNTAGAEMQQAVVLRVSADRAVAYRCCVDGYQDTLNAHALRHLYRECFVSGTVDFVFCRAARWRRGAAQAGPAERGHRAGPGGPQPEHGHVRTSLHRCRVVPAPDLAPVAGAGFPTFLGRPWKAYSRTVVMRSYLEAHVHPRGWLEWDGDFALKTLFYGEYQNEGPGAGKAGRGGWPGYHVIADRSVALQFTVGQFIQGGNWLNGTGVPYLSK
ncbi:hypothetical protein U9M48_017486 [Paspalum notatum var. saurae]|uniref:Pectinesterase n=1 Tax=Paspalum notatum var. saurae TaxID=547442 RepID=A0AAQ3T7Y8_PASNO